MLKVKGRNWWTEGRKNQRGREVFKRPKALGWRKKEGRGRIIGRGRVDRKRGISPSNKEFRKEEESVLGTATSILRGVAHSGNREGQLNDGTLVYRQACRKSQGPEMSTRGYPQGKVTRQLSGAVGGSQGGDLGGKINSKREED